MSKRD